MTDNLEAVQSKQSKTGESQISGNPGESLSKEDASKEFLKDLIPNEVSGTEDNFVPDQKQDSVPKGSESLPNVTIEKQKNFEKKHDEQEKDRIIFSPEEGIDIYRDNDSKLGPNNTSDNVLERLTKKIYPEVTEEDRAKSKETLSNEISDLIPAKDQKSLRAMQSALVDGDLKSFSKAVQDVSGNPERLKQLVKELNNQLEDNEKFGGIDIHISKGNVIMHDSRGDIALKINAKTGEPSIHPIQILEDGSVVLAPGEIVNKEPEDVMLELGDEVSLSLNRDCFFSVDPHISNGKYIYKPDKFTRNPAANFMEGDVRPYYNKPGGLPSKPMQEDSFIRGFQSGLSDMAKGIDRLMNKLQ